MPGQRREIERQLTKLPESFAAKDIETMYNKLINDVRFLKSRGVSLHEMESELHKKHKTLSFSYPTMFFKTVRGEMDEHMFKTLIKLKGRVDSGELTNVRAKELVIDEAKHQVEGGAPRPVRPKKEGGTVQEINIKRRIDEEISS